LKETQEGRGGLNLLGDYRGLVVTTCKKGARKEHGGGKRQ